VNPPDPLAKRKLLRDKANAQRKTKRMLPSYLKIEKAAMQTRIKALLGNFSSYLILPKLPKGKFSVHQVASILPQKNGLLVIVFPHFLTLGK
jgi:hypothetical protein